MKNQFFYTRKVQNQPVEGETEPTFTTTLDSFNPSLITRTVEIPEGRRIVALNDFHEESKEVPIFNKQGKLSGRKNEKYTFQSEIILEKADADRFKEMFAL